MSVTRFKKQAIFFSFQIGLLTLLMLNPIDIHATAYMAYKAKTAPVVDGIGNEDCWNNASWANINQPFDGKSLPDSADFYGRYKAVWTTTRLYVLMEITDDKLIDNRIHPSDNYWEDDCTEFFIDEDFKPQGHECGAEAFNAFAYHIAAVARDKNNYTNGSIVSFDSPDAINHVIDLGNDCNTGKALNLDDHVVTKITRNGNKYTWELEFKIFEKNYNPTSTTNTPVTLTANKQIGFAIAYCDNDNGKRESMVGTVPNHFDYGGKYPFYRFTNEFETLTLNDTVLTNTNERQINSLQRVSIYPNPAVDILNISVNNSQWQFNTIKITNLLGQTVLCKKSETNSTQLNLSNLQPGLYIIEVSNQGGKILQKILKERI